MMELPAPDAPAARLRMLQLAKRLLLGLGVVGVVAMLVFGILLARLDVASVEREALAHFQKSTGYALTYKTRKDSRLPRPSVTLENVSIVQDGRAVLTAREAVLRFDLMDLIDGVIDSPQVTLRNATATLDTLSAETALRSPRSLIEAFQRLSSVMEGHGALSRFSLDAGDLRLALAGGVTLGPMETRVRYHAGRGRLDLNLKQAGSIVQGQPTPLAQQPFSASLAMPTRSALATGRSQPIKAQLTLGDSRLEFSGEGRESPDVTLTGRIDSMWGETFERLINWQKSARDTRPDATRLEAGVTLDARGLGFDALRLTVGSRTLAGIASLREQAGRWGLSATLGGDLVDGTAAHRVLQGIRDQRGGWSQAPLSLNPLPQIDLDLRLSTKSFRLGRFALTQVALSVLSRPNRTEMAIVDSRFGEGSFKARVFVSDPGSGNQTMRLSVAGENVEGGELLDQALGFDRLAGVGSFVVQVQGQGGTVAALMGSLNGSAAMDIKNGSITGIDLTRLMTRAAEQRAETALLFSLVGKTAFESLRTDFSFRDGKMEPVGSHFITRNVEASLEGASDIVTQQHKMSIILRKRSEGGEPQSDFFGFRLEGPLLAPVIKPDQSLLQNRG